MKRDPIEVFQGKLKSHNIKGKDLAAISGRNPKTISEILNRKASPSLDNFTDLIECCDRLSPGFADDFYAALLGRVDWPSLVRSMSCADLSSLLIIVSSRMAELLPRERERIAA